MTFCKSVWEKETRANGMRAEILRQLGNEKASTSTTFLLDQINKPQFFHFRDQYLEPWYLHLPYSLDANEFSSILSPNTIPVSNHMQPRRKMRVSRLREYTQHQYECLMNADGTYLWLFSEISQKETAQIEMVNLPLATDSETEIRKKQYTHSTTTHMIGSTKYTKNNESMSSLMRIYLSLKHILGIVMIFPFIVLVVASVPQILPSKWLQIRSEPQWSRLLSWITHYRLLAVSGITKFAMASIRNKLEACIRLPSGFQNERIRWLYDGISHARIQQKPSYLLYWMQTSVRTKYNYSLEYAIAAAAALHIPLQVVYFFSDQSTVPASQLPKDPNAFAFSTERHAKFALEGLACTEKRLRERGLSFKVLYHTPEKDPPLVDGDSSSFCRKQLLSKCAQHALLVVTDRPYLRPAALDTLKCATNASETQLPWGMVQIEGDVVVPCETTSKKEEYAARTIRPKITQLLPSFIKELEHVSVPDFVQSVDRNLFQFPTRYFLVKSPASDTNEDILEFNLSQLKDILALLKVDRNVPGLSNFRGGEDEASLLTKVFLEKKLSNYALGRNEPSNDGTSNISLYLHFGHISPVRIALATHKIKAASSKASRDAFLEEMIVRRELSVNMVVFNPHTYDSMECIPNFAKKTLEDHANDKRPFLYTLEELEAAKTYDQFWNAAQMEMLFSGKMHGYMRMYWAKKILEWSASPTQAYTHALYLNNKYCLDAPDPNSYTGIAWSFGKHDQGWKERPIFGKQATKRSLTAGDK
uniref:Deoxyribodipyrimidine photo-lyase n=1 Tax=Albugo laibachii Nc14 TaxID=890382 RepID=F0W2A3_9STRA|nr:deoxyribodipyrimidine photolyase putative [Albugo laibachii Nc14]|eukprot:CCA15188.1 deoxyribodipyrimidine photolyase putative [Albugo laibachii Nc14]